MQLSLWNQAWKATSRNLVLLLSVLTISPIVVDEVVGIMVVVVVVVHNEFEMRKK